MARPPKQTSEVASIQIAFRLTPGEKATLDSLVVCANKTMQLQGLPPVISAASLVRTLIQRAAQEAGLLPDGGQKPWEVSVTLQPSRKRPKGFTEPMPAPTCFSKILGDEEAPHD